VVVQEIYEEKTTTKLLAGAVCMSRASKNQIISNQIKNKKIQKYYCKVV